MNDLDIENFDLFMGHINPISLFCSEVGERTKGMNLKKKEEYNEKNEGI